MELHKEDVLAERSTIGDPRSRWRTTSIEKLKSFYRLMIPKNQRLPQQPKTKLEWIDFIGPKLSLVTEQEIQQLSQNDPIEENNH